MVNTVIHLKCLGDRPVNSDARDIGRKNGRQISVWGGSDRGWLMVLCLIADFCLWCLCNDNVGAIDPQ